MRFVVSKLGAAAVSTRAGWEAVSSAVGPAMGPVGQRTVVVCEAVDGVAEGLRDLAVAAAAGAFTEFELEGLADRHRALARELDVDASVIAADLEEIGRLVAGVGLVGEAGPRVIDRLEAVGPRMAARLGAAWLAAQGHDAGWAEGADLLAREERQEAASLLPTLRERVAGRAITVLGGGVARQRDGQPSGLGPGGVDVSAAILAVRLGAVRCDVWSERPGLFTADPQKLPGARLLKTLDYLEAQQLATMGAGAAPVHPRALGPLREARIPLHVRCLSRPDLEGTTIAPEASGGAAQVKAIAGRKGLVLVSMDTVGMWQQVGFLAKAFGVFASLGLSVDSVSTSETEVTATLDPSVEVDGGTLERLVAELSPLCRARVQPGCASVSLVGRGIRGILHQLAPVLEVFEEQPVHIVSQAASDLNLTFVVDEGGADRLVARLHALLFAHRGADALLGPTWQELFAPGPKAAAPVVVEPWWTDARDALLAVAAAGTPAYVTHGPTVDARAAGLLGLEHVARVLYAVKANPHPGIVARLAAAGIGFETVSPGEIARVRAAAGGGPFVLFTPNFAPRAELEGALGAGNVQVTLDDLHPLEHWPELFAGRDLFVRIDPGRGKGHHAHVRTAGSRSKFGVAPDQLDRLVALARDAGARIVGLHAHVGSGVLDPGSWREVALSLVPVAERLPDVRVLDLGGGLGVPDRPGRPSLDLGALDQALAQVRRAHPERDLWLEPGRYLVAEAGVLLATVTQLKRKGDLLYVGVDAGMHTLLRPALYGAYHPVVNLSRLHEAATTLATVVGPICETGDVLARDRLLAEPREGDVLLIGVAGAYGAAMASDYNLRGRPRDVILEVGG
jgi:bifunctional diaminopimelate decarboxylase / aspartate kinase